MSGFDAGAVYTNESLVQRQFEEDNPAIFQIARRKFRDFFKQFNDGNFVYKYRDQLKRNCNLQQYHVTVNIQDLNLFDETLGHHLVTRPNEYLPILEEAASNVAEELTHSGPENDENEPPGASTEDKKLKIQVLLTSDASISGMRQLKSDNVSRLIKVSGIVIAASAVRAKATHLSLQCRGCREYLSGIPVRPGLEGYMLPRKCPRAAAASAAGGGAAAVAAGGTQCPVDPFFIVPDKCKCVDYQILKLQESPESVPQGEVPRHLQLYCDRYLCERVIPGNRITVTGVFSIKRAQQVNSTERRGNRDKTNAGVKQPYVRVLGLDVEGDGSGGVGRAGIGDFTETEEEEFRRLASQPDIYNVIAKSIAPSIFGSVDIKKAIACLLFGGSRKRLPDGLFRRGDINVLLLGDPGTAKSQLLKFVERCAPIAVYTSGKGSSAAGLTASVTRDPTSHNFVMEGGAMVLADGGVVCIDEFDKMREDDRVAIHEAMEQQTISIAKAGITTTLNSRCSVLAAANSVFGRWDDTKGEENIDFMPTILSRFDTIFVVKDEHNEERDITLAKHVMSVHMRGGANDTEQTTEEGEVPLNTLKRFIAYCRKRCGPRISERAAEKLRNQYVLLRSGASSHERETGKRALIPITVRQLEAIVRISESLAKMRLDAFANENDVEEALRLFQVSTLEAAMAGHLEGAEGFTSQEDHELLLRVEKQIKRRFVIGSQVSEHTIVQDFVRQGYPEGTVNKVLSVMLRRGEIQHRMQRRILYRIQ